MQGFGAGRREKKVAGSAQAAVELAAEAFQDAGRGARKGRRMSGMTEPNLRIEDLALTLPGAV